MVGSGGGGGSESRLIRALLSISGPLDIFLCKGVEGLEFGVEPVLGGAGGGAEGRESWDARLVGVIAEPGEGYCCCPCCPGGGGGGGAAAVCCWPLAMYDVDP